MRCSWCGINLVYSETGLCWPHLLRVVVVWSSMMLWQIVLAAVIVGLA